MEYYVSIDVGGTFIKYGLLNEQGEIIAKGSRETEAYKGGSAILEKVEKIAEDFQKQYEISGICISTAGMVDCEEGKIFYSGELIPDYTGTSFKEAIEKKYGIPCEVENDVNCAGIAESVLGAAKDAKVAVCLTVGTGIGGCLLIDGEVFHGFSNSACEIGYMKMRGSDFQTLGASSVLSKKVAQRKGEAVSKWPGEKIFEAAKTGDTECIEAIQEMADALAEGISNICYVTNPQVVILGGGIAAQEAYLKPLIEQYMSEYLKPVILKKTRVEFAMLRNDAGMLGAFYHFMQRRKAKNP